MNGYDLHRMRLNFRFENPDKCRAIHSELFMYIVDLWNRLGQKSQFGLPTQMTMELLGIGSYNTYNKTYEDLLSRGFIKEIQKSKNQYSARIIAISKNDKALDKALDKATIKATDETTDTIDKQVNKETNKQYIYPPEFENFWKTYPHARKGKKDESYKYFKNQNYEEVIECVKLYAEEIKIGLQDIKFVPACERWIRDFVYNEQSNRAKLFGICEQMIKKDISFEAKRQLATDFEKYNIKSIFKEIRDRKTDLLIHSIINAG